MTYITNLYPDPSCYKQLGSWQSSGGVNVEHLPDGRYRYTHTGDDWSLSDWDSWKVLMRLGRVVVVAYTATSGLSVAVENGMTLVSGTTPSGAAWTAAKINGDGNRSIFCQGGGSLTLEALRVRGRRMADRPTTPPPVPVVRRRLDAPAVIGGERR